MIVKRCDFCDKKSTDLPKPVIIKNNYFGIGYLCKKCLEDFLKKEEKADE